MKTFKGFIIGLIIEIVATFAFAYTCMDSYFAMVMEKIHNVVQVFDNDNTSSSSENYDDLTIDEKVALFEQGQGVWADEKEKLREKSIDKNEVFSKNEELYYVVISTEITFVHDSYLKLMEEYPDMPKIYFYYDENLKLAELDIEKSEYIFNTIGVNNIEELRCRDSLLTIENGMCTSYTEYGQDIYDKKIKDIYREYLESKKNS